MFKSKKATKVFSAADAERVARLLHHLVVPTTLQWHDEIFDSVDALYEYADTLKGER